MTTNLLTTGNVDFDNCFEKGSGNQLLYIYAQDGADIGQKYYNVSEGSAYGTTGMLASSGKDVGNLLCKAGTRDDGSVVLTCGSYTLMSTTWIGYWKKLVGGDYIGSLSRTPYWLVNGSKVSLSELYIYTTATRTGTYVYLSNSEHRTSIITAVNGVAFTSSSSSVDDTTKYNSIASGNPLGLSNGAKVTLKFTPAPDGFL